MCQESAEDGSLRRIQLDTALKALYTSSESLSHTVEGDMKEGGTRSDAMDTAEPSVHAQVRIRHVILSIALFSPCDSFCTSYSRDFLSPLDFTSFLLVPLDHFQVKDEGPVSQNTGKHSDGECSLVPGYEARWVVRTCDVYMYLYHVFWSAQG